MPFLSSILNYFGSQETVHNHIGEANAKKPIGNSTNTRSTLERNTISMEGAKSSHIDLSGTVSNEGSKENEAFCNTVSHETTEFVSNMDTSSVQVDRIACSENDIESGSGNTQIDGRSVNAEESTKTGEKGNENCCQADDDNAMDTEMIDADQINQTNLDWQSESLNRYIPNASVDGNGLVSSNDALNTNTSTEQSDSDASKDGNLVSAPSGENSNAGPSLVDENSNMTSSSLNSVITQSMVEEETQYEKEDKAEASKVKQVVEDIRAAPEDERFDRLKNLLDRSNVYAQFLLKRMDQQREQEKLQREAKEKTRGKRAEEMAKMKEVSQIFPDTKTNGTRSWHMLSQGPTVKMKVERKGKRKSHEEPIGKRKKMKKEEETRADNYEEGLSEKVQDGKQHIRKINDEVVSDRQPSLVTGGIMRSYQIDGMEWMRGLFENGINGILADEMGLGKTLQCISLLAYFIERGMKGPFLIAAPLSTLPNWVSEFKKFTPKVKTLLYHGTKEERLLMRRKILKLRMIDGEKNIKAYPVVITSYEIVMRDRAFLNIYPWKYIIIDEGHRIKNLNCRLIRELKTYNTANRLLLTGTPLQNNLAELWSLLNFLLPDIFDDLNSFQEWFDFNVVSEDGGDEKLIAQEQENHVLETLHAILTPFLLRRLKTDVDLTIPPKQELIVYAPLTAEQQEYYKGILNKTILSKIKSKMGQEPILEYTSTGRPKRRTTQKVDYTKMLGGDDSETFDFEELLKTMTEEDERKKAGIEAANAEKASSVVSIRLQNILMQLRKCCNHPYLLEHPIDPETKEYLVNESNVKVSGKMKLLDQMLPELKKRGHKVLLFSQMTKMLDIIEDFCYLRQYGYSRIDGSMKFQDRQEMIEKFNGDPEVFLFLLSTRAGGLGLNLSSADTCIIYDSDWNPQVDLQAQDRCHRIGQTKPVLIFRYVTANSIDEKVVERAASKRKLEKMVIHKGRFKGKETPGRLSTQDLLELLQSKDHSQVSSIGEDFVITEESLNQMLDRSSLISKSEPIVISRAESHLFKVVEQSQEDALL